MKRVCLILAVAAVGATGGAVGAMAQPVHAGALLDSAGWAFQAVDWHGDRDGRGGYGGHGYYGHGRGDGGHYYRGHDHGGVRTGIYFGFGDVWGPWWGPGPYWGPRTYYYNPPVVIAPPPPTVYISPEQQSQPYYWYYCESARRYFPYVQECPGGWMKVVPSKPAE